MCEGDAGSCQGKSNFKLNFGTEQIVEQNDCIHQLIIIFTFMLNDPLLPQGLQHRYRYRYITAHGGMTNKD